MDLGKLLLKKIVDVAKDYLDSSTKDLEPRRQSRPEQRPEPKQEPEAIERTDAEWKTYFREILQREFSSYTLRENVKVTDLAGYVSDEFKLYKKRPNQVYKAEWGQPYTFVLESAGAPKAVVMLGDGHSHDSNVKYLIARMYAKKLGMPYINFYTQMPNERSYVVERVRKFLD
ncbi:MAG: hypothetical protein J5734_04055 [Prevotella sp.]|nr:hypothetical protein [Prevotella sp.]MBR5698590.1 hypothetical protein [Prevotella sp.]